jgi:hypothetical protein
MRQIIDANQQININHIDISNVKINPRCRDGITQLLIGLQYLYTNIETREQIFELLKEVPQKNVNNGRPGMDLWQILVLALLRVNCNIDWDLMHSLANNHDEIRQMMGITDWIDKPQFSLQSLKDNVSLLKVETIDKINLIGVNAGQKLVKKKGEEELRGRCDSFVVETNVHYPTDINLLLDAMRKIITLMHSLYEITGIAGTRKYKYKTRQLKKIFRKLQKMKRSTSKDEKKKKEHEELIKETYKEYLKLANKYLSEARKALFEITEKFQEAENTIKKINCFIAHAERQIDQIRRRCINGEVIPHDEKVFSIFEEHTEWISKGKAGVPVELGVRVCIIEDQYGFILGHRIMMNETDVDITIPIIRDRINDFPNFKGCSFDKGFWSPKNFEGLKELLDYIVLPKKGKLSSVDKVREYTEDFLSARRKHSAVESGINALENHGLDRCPDRGQANFERYISLSVLGRNFQKLGSILQAKELKRLRQKKRNGNCELKIAA